MHFLKPFSISILASLGVATPIENLSKRDLIDPNKPHLSTDQQCSWVENYAAVYQYNVVINKAKDYTDDECGSGFLDNLRADGCKVTNWGCNYANDDETMNASFQTDLFCFKDTVEGDIYKAFGQLEGVECKEYK